MDCGGDCGHRGPANPTASTLFRRTTVHAHMSDAMDRRDELADELAASGWDVIDTFGGLEERPSLVVAVDGLEIEDTTFDQAEVTVTVSRRGIDVGRVEISDDELDLSYDERNLLDDVCEEKLSGPEITVWEYEPGSSEDNVEEIMAEVREVADELSI